MKTLRQFLSCLIALSILPTAINAQWFWQNPIPQNNKLPAVKAISSSLAYAVGNSAAVFKTTNGGANWAKLDMGSGIYQDFTTLYFTSATTGWVSGGGYGFIVMMTDGGTTRTKSTTTWSITAMCFIDATTGFAAGNYGTVVKTTDGGQNWTKLTAPSGSPDLYSICFKSATTGVVVGVSCNCPLNFYLF